MKERISCFGIIQRKLVGFKPSVVNFLSSLFIVSKTFSLLELKINKFVSSANIIGVSSRELLKR